MGGIQGENLQEIRSDLEAINEPGFWSIVGTFEGSWTLARFKEFSKKEFVSEGRAIKVGKWQSSKSRDEYKSYVEEIRSLIAAGEVYQVNACRIMTSKILEEGNFSGLFFCILFLYSLTYYIFDYFSSLCFFLVTITICTIFCKW